MKKSTQLDQYASLIGEDMLNVIYEKASKLRGLRVLHINTTAKGGGVAEILEGLESGGKQASSSNGDTAAD